MSDAKFERYDAYKDSGVEWIGDVPEYWDVKHFKQFSTMKGRIGWQGLKHSEFIDEGPFLITGMNFKEGRINWNDVYHINEERYKQAPEIQLKDHDVLMTKDGTIGKLLYVENIPAPSKASLNSHLLVLRPIKKSFHPKYMYYQLDSATFKHYTEIVKAGTTFFGISQAAVGRYISTLPPFFEQTAIAAYLDTKTAHIDRKIDLLTQKASQYSKLKQSLINKTVTRGLDKSVVMKDSGVEWLGDVPEHWKVKRIKEISEINKRTLSEKTSANYEFNYVDIGSVTYGVEGFATERMTFDIAPSRAKRVVKKGDTIISTVRTYLKAIASIDDDVSDLIVSTGFAVISPNKRLFNKYYSYLLTSDFIVNEICALSTGVNYPPTNSSVIGDLFCLVPTYSEQQTIADYLGTKTDHIGRIIETINSQIEKLKELRKTLINDVVTGKIKVA